MKHPTVYIGIVTYNSAAVISKCLQSIFAQRYKHIVVTICDNHSQDKTMSIVKKYMSRLTIIRNDHNVGFGRAHNEILKQLPLGRSDFYLPLNPDIELHPAYVEELVRSLIKQKADWGTGKLFKKNNENKKILYSVGHAMLKDGYAFNIGFNQVDSGQYDNDREIFGAPAAASLMSAALIRRLSHNNDLFDSRMFLYNEDTDLDWRARLRGFRCVYAHKAMAVHIGSHPTGIIALHALANRYRSVIKNAFITDLIFYNIPRIFLHLCFRFFMSFSEGFWLSKQIVSNIPSALTQRTKPVVQRGYMEHWFIKNNSELTNQPTSISTRMRLFIKKHYAHV